MGHRERIGMRLTRKYVGTHKHMDDWVDIGMLNVIESKVVPRVYDEDDYPDVSDVDPIFIKGNLELDNGVKIVKAECECCEDDDERSCFTMHEVERAIVDSLSSWGCSHEYDCCGCISESASIIEEKSKPEDLYFEIRIGRSANY